MPSYVITGAAKGLGLEFVSQLSSDAKNTVFALVRNKSTATVLKGLPITILEADITDVESLKAAASVVAAATGGKLDYLINNAGVHDRAKVTLSTYPEDLESNLLEYVSSFRVNTIGTLHATNTFLPLLRAGATKKVVTLSTGAADAGFATALGSPGQAAYAISKAALNMAVTKFAMALKDEGFVFLAISPGLVDTAVGTRSPEEDEQYKAFWLGFRKVSPNFEGPLTPQISVKTMLEVIDRWTVEETGAFVSHHGNKEWL
ncbi:hypothetical protein DFH07DRAFT_759546 [Mycena maculata]|uniref:Ketoreductase domain-containing protein n=1 Tax=Mycena maculata TaxID=230809 RepID=A0AAD7HMK6_9AGAR|nr:hypothetical protein DFH07DRAFT_759546 [Mycena maculata]